MNSDKASEEYAVYKYQLSDVEEKYTMSKEECLGYLNEFHKIFMKSLLDGVNNGELSFNMVDKNHINGGYQLLLTLLRIKYLNSEFRAEPTRFVFKLNVVDFDLEFEKKKNIRREELRDKFFRLRNEMRDIEKELNSI